MGIAWFRWLIVCGRVTKCTAEVGSRNAPQKLASEGTLPKATRRARKRALSRDRYPSSVRSESVYVCGEAVRRKSVYVRFLPVRESDLSPCSVRWKGVGDWVGRQ